MRIGTRSLLFGVHAFYLHPWFVARAWWKLYGFPTSFPLWVFFFVHDLGYFGKPNMDGPEGETHPELGAAIMRRLFGEEWGEFTLYHSRFYARLKGRNFSQACVADKLASMLYPWWLYRSLATLSGEMAEYQTGAGNRVRNLQSPRAWWETYRAQMTDWVNQNRDKGDRIPGAKSNQTTAA